MKRTASTLDMTSGPILPLVLRFALPLVAGNVLQQMYSTVDTLVISNFCGTNSLAAVGTSAQPLEILLCLFMGLGSGVSILVAQHVGSRDDVQLTRVVRNAGTFLYCCAIPLTVLGMFLCPLIMRLMQIPDSTMAPALTYIRILLLGTLGSLGYNMNAGILRGLGDSRSSLWFLVASSLVNIVLDLAFIAGLGMDVAGAALATVIAQFTSWLVSAAYLRLRYPQVGYTLRPRRLDRDTLQGILRIALPLGFNNSFYSVGHLVLQTLINTQGPAFMAACSLASRLSNMANVALTSLSSSATTFAGQNLGAGQYRRLRQGAWRIPLFSGVLTLATGLVLVLTSRPLLSFFGPEPEVLELAVHYGRVVYPFFWTYAVFNAIICFVNGMGKVRYTMVVNVLMLWVVRIPAAWIIVRFIDGNLVMAAYPISFTVGMLAMLCYFLTPAWRTVLARARATQATP